MIPASKPAFYASYVPGYVRRYLARSFHAVHLLGPAPQLEDDGKTPLLVCMNHSSWWDVLLAFYLDERFLKWERYGVMDEEQLRRYRLFNGLGMIGVDRSSLRGAREFVTYAESLLKGQRRALWLTPQGAMLSPYSRPIRFQPGLAHLAERLGCFYMLRVTLHYEFWDDKQPEAFVAFAPIESVQIREGFSRRAFLHEQEAAMESELEALLAAVRQRAPEAFLPLLTGRSEISPAFDLFRALSAKLRGEKYVSDHSSLSTPKWKDRLR